MRLSAKRLSIVVHTALEHLLGLVTKQLPRLSIENLPKAGAKIRHGHFAVLTPH